MLGDTLFLIDYEQKRNLESLSYLTISSVQSHVSGNSLRTLTDFLLASCFFFGLTISGRLDSENDNAVGTGAPSGRDENDGYIGFTMQTECQQERK